MRIIDNQIEEFLAYCRIKHLSPKTIKSYSQSLLLFAEFLEKELGITDAERVKAPHVNTYIGYLQERGKYTVVAPYDSLQPNYPNRRTDYKRQISKTTINNYLRNMRVFFNYLEEYDYIVKSPFQKVKLLRDSRKPLTFVEDRQFAELLRCMDSQRYNVKRDRVIIQLLLDSGMRIGECLLIKVDDVNFSYNSIELPWENTKGKKTRTVFFSAEMRKILRQWLKIKSQYNDSEYLFSNSTGGKLAINSFESSLRDYVKNAGLQGITPKTFRNNFAKRFLNNGGDIFILSKILGHSSVKVTEKAYLDLNDDDLRRNYQDFSPIANMKIRG